MKSVRKHSVAGGSGPAGRTRVLVVEDNFAERKLFCRILAKAGHRVSEAASAHRARRMIVAGDFDLILVDLVLKTERDGIDLIKFIQNDPLLRNIPVIAMTGYGSALPILAEALKLGAKDGLPKPIPMGVLTAKVDRILADDPRRTKHVEDNGGSLPVTNNKIVIVDDDDGFRPLLEMAFDRAGFKTYTASRGVEAVDLAKRLKPATVILDFGLPDITGLEVVKALKNDSETSGILVVIITGSDVKGREVTCLVDGADDYLVKGSCSMEALVAHVRALLRIQGIPLVKCLKVGPVILNVDERTILVDDKPAKRLTPKEFDLLAFLMSESPNIIGWEALAMRFSDALPATPQKAQDPARVHLCHVKKKLGQKGAACLVTHKLEGLQFLPPSDKGKTSKTASDGGPRRGWKS